MNNLFSSYFFAGHCECQFTVAFLFSYALTITYQKPRVNHIFTKGYSVSITFLQKDTFTFELKYLFIFVSKDTFIFLSLDK